MTIKPTIIKQTPSVRALLETVETLVHIYPDEIRRVDSFARTDDKKLLETLNKAICLSRDALSIRIPGDITSDHSIKTWISGHSENLDWIIATPDIRTRVTIDEIRRSPLVNGPFANSRNYVPQGHVIIGMTENLEEVVRGEVGENMTVNWFWKIDEQRLAAAEQLLENIDIDNILAQEGYWISSKGAWKCSHGFNVWSFNIDTNCGEKDHPSSEMSISVGFEPGTDKIVMTKLSCRDLGINRNIMPEDDSPEP